jgi:putative secretion ATPase (PEP-CTERM system associated)
MYTTYYNLNGRPFQISPDYRFFFGSRPHQKAMAYLEYGIAQGEGFIVITGDIGTGKTTLVEYLFSRLDTGKFIAAKVGTTQLEADDMLRMIACSFGIPHEGADKATLLKQIEEFLVRCRHADRRTLLVIDEVQNVPPRSLEELRMLSNLQYQERALLQTYLVGQPQFRATLASDRLEQLRQRVIASHHLQPMDAVETRGYIEHRLHRVGWHRDPDITSPAFDGIFQQTRGVPRKINLLCERLLLFGYLEDIHQIDAGIVQEVVQDLNHEISNSSNVPAVAANAPIAPNNHETQATPARPTEIDKLARRVAKLERYVKAQNRRLKRALAKIAPENHAREGRTNTH